jgi:hypothetical protein
LLDCMLLEKNGRGERIRTSGLLVPNQALYQAEPRPVTGENRRASRNFHARVAEPINLNIA